jgi:hypothetical protein
VTHVGNELQRSHALRKGAKQFLRDRARDDHVVSRLQNARYSASEGRKAHVEQCVRVAMTSIQAACTKASALFSLADSSLDRLFDLLFKAGFDARNLVAERHFKVRVT